MLSEYVGVDVSVLKALNPGVDLDFVFPGDRVVVHVERQQEQEQQRAKEEAYDEVREKVPAAVDSQQQQQHNNNNNNNNNDKNNDNSNDLREVGLPSRNILLGRGV